MKNKKKSIFVIIFILFSFLIYKSFSSRDEKREDPIYCKYVNEINSGIIRDVRKQYGLVYSGGGGGFMKNVNLISLSFSGTGTQHGVEYCRVLLVSCIETLLDRVNSDEKLLPYLEHFPYTDKGVKVSIGFDTRKEKSKSVAHVFNHGGNIYYSYYDEKENLTRLYQESYEEALRIVKEQGLLEIVR